MDRPAIKAITRGFLTLSPCIPAPILNDKGQRHTSLAARVGGVANSRVRSATPKHPPPGKPGRLYLLVPLRVVPLRRNLTYIGISRVGCFKYKPYVLEVPVSASRRRCPRTLPMKGRDLKMPMTLMSERELWWHVLKISYNYFHLL